MNRISYQETILYLRTRNNFGTHLVSSTANVRDPFRKVRILYERLLDY